MICYFSTDQWPPTRGPLDDIVCRLMGRQPSIVGCPFKISSARLANGIQTDHDIVLYVEILFDFFMTKPPGPHLNIRFGKRHCLQTDLAALAT